MKSGSTTQETLAKVVFALLPLTPIQALKK